MNISQAEHHVLEVLWRESPLTVGQVVERVQENIDWHENTIKTLLNRLLKKKAVRREKDGRRYFYQPAVARHAVASSAVDGLLERFFDGRVHQLVAHFADHEKLSPQEIAEMEAVLERLKDNAG